MQLEGGPVLAKFDFAPQFFLFAVVANIGLILKGQLGATNGD